MKVSHWILLFSLSILWGASFYFTEKALFYFSFEQITFLRVFIAALFLFIILLIQKVKIYFSLKLLGIFFILGLFNNVIPFLGFTYAQETISSSLASLCNATTPIFTALLAHFFTQDEKLKLRIIVGVIIGFVGMLILINPTQSLTFEFGVSIALFSAFSFAVAGIFGKYFKEYNPLFTAFGMLSASSLVLFIVFFESIVQIKFNSFYEMQDLLMLAILSTAIAYIIYFNLLFKIGVVRLLLITYLVPVSASILGVLLLNETITLNMYIGALFIFFSLWIINKEHIATHSK